MILYRYDLWPAALTVAGLAAILAGRERLGFASLGLGIAAKVFPAVVLPPALVYVWRTRGRRDALICLGLAAAVVALVLVPFLALAPRGLWDSVVRQTTRPLQIESLGVGGAARRAPGRRALDHAWSRATARRTWPARCRDALGTVSTVLLVVALLAIWLAAARGPATPERLVRYSAASLVAFVALEQGALAAVPDLADPDRAARSRPPRARRLGAPRARAAADTALVPDPLLGSRAPLRRRSPRGHVLARDLVLLALLACSAGAYATGTRSASQLSARP